MITYRKLSAVAALGTLLSVGACHGDYLSGGELSTDPNRATTATARNLMVTTELALWNLWGGDPARSTGIYAQEFSGLARQYAALDQTYAQDPNTTNGFHTGLYSAGGLVDIKSLETGGDRGWRHDLPRHSAQCNRREHDGHGGGRSLATSFTARRFRELRIRRSTRSSQVYDSVQKVLSAAITNLSTFHSGGTNTGPGGTDLVYGGSASKWKAMAHTLKARFYMHNGEIDASNYAKALAEAQLGITDPSGAGDYAGNFTSTGGEKNFYYQFNDEQRGDLGAGGPTIDSLLVAHNDPRRSVYFTVCTAAIARAYGCTVGAPAPAGIADFGDIVNDPAYPTKYVSYDENTLIWSEAAYRTNDQTTARNKLNEERANHGLAAFPASLTGRPLLNEILLEKYVVDFALGEEAWNDYKRTCTPNLVPHTTSKKIPGRLFYDAGEQQTNTNIPAPGTGINGYRNSNDPPNATSDGTGARCLGQ